MRSRWIWVFLSLFLMVGLSAVAHQQTVSATTPTQSLTQDPQALTVVQQAFAAMGGAQAILLTDCLATGQAQIFSPDGTSATFPITKKSKGTKMIRTELQRPEGTHTRIVNNGLSALINFDGTVRHQRSNSTVAERIEHIPVLSTLSEWESTNIEIRYVGTDNVNGAPVQVVAIAFNPTSDPQWTSFYRSLTQTLFFIDQGTSLVSKMQYQNFADDNSDVSERVEVLFSVYRAVTGVLVPFTQTTYADGQLRSKVTFTNVAFNVGLADSEFAIPGGN